MNSRYRKLRVESLERRSVLSTMVMADFNRDGRTDQAAITEQGTIEIRLDNGNGGYNISDVLTASKSQTFVDILSVHDSDDDGDLDLAVVAAKSSGNMQIINFANNGNGTFEYLVPVKSKFSRWWV